MEYIYKSKTLKKDFIFSRPGSYYIYVNTNGKSGIMGPEYFHKPYSNK